MKELKLMLYENNKYIINVNKMPKYPLNKREIKSIETHSHGKRVLVTKVGGETIKREMLKTKLNN